MGAWDVGHFDNDSALDWVQDILEGNDLKQVKKLLSSIANPKGIFGFFKSKENYLDADQACYGLVAGEVIATIIGKPSDELPDDLMEWIQSNDFSVTKPEIDMARKAIVRIKEDSELRELWVESDEFEEWKQKVEDLERRLE